MNPTIRKPGSKGADAESPAQGAPFIDDKAVLGQLKRRSVQGTTILLSAQVIKLGYEIVEVPITYNPRYGEDKKLTPLDGIPTLWQLVRCRFRPLGSKGKVR